MEQKDLTLLGAIHTIYSQRLASPLRERPQAIAAGEGLRRL